MSDPDQGTGGTCYLTDLSPSDKPWDQHRAQADRVRDLYQGTLLDALAGRMGACSGLLQFVQIVDPESGECKLKLKAARFCRVRTCPVCAWRRSLMWVARFLKALPRIQKDYPTARYVFLTLTVKNCELSELRSTLTWMNESWKRLTHRKPWPAIGFARSTEITRAKDGQVHPHFHALLMVQPGYFKGERYLSQERWSELWQDCLKVAYKPVVDVRAVKPNKRRLDGAGEPLAADEALAAAIVETLKYSVKPSDLIGEGSEVDKEWLVELTSQLHKMRAIALGGVFKNYLSESDPEDLIGEDLEDQDNEIGSLSFGWRELIARYVYKA